jgi:hypothetical protein
MPGPAHCRHCYGACPGNCLLPGTDGLCIHRPAPKLTPGQRLALLCTRRFWLRVLHGTR